MSFKRKVKQRLKRKLVFYSCGGIKPVLFFFGDHMFSWKRRIMFLYSTFSFQGRVGGTTFSPPGGFDPPHQSHLQA